MVDGSGDSMKFWTKVPFESNVLMFTETQLQLESDFQYIIYYVWSIR